MEGWRRAMDWEDTGLPWVAPSPNMPTPDTARVYPGGCLIEGTNLSEGRGTTRPFELVGAPWLEGQRARAARSTPAPAARRRLPPRRVHADVPEAQGRAVRRRAAPRHRPAALPLLPHRRWPSSPRPAARRRATSSGGRPPTSSRRRSSPSISSRRRRHPPRHRARRPARPDRAIVATRPAAVRPGPGTVPALRLRCRRSHEISRDEIKGKSRSRVTRPGRRGRAPRCPRGSAR